MAFTTLVTQFLLRLNNIFSSVRGLNTEMMITILKVFRVLCIKVLFMFVYMNYFQLILKSVLGIFNSSVVNEYPEILASAKE